MLQDKPDCNPAVFKHSMKSLAAGPIVPLVMERPELKRMEVSLWLRARPIARRTREGSRMPDVRAQPVDAANLDEWNDESPLT